MDYFRISFVPKACEQALRLFSQDTDIVAETLFLGQYGGPCDEESIKRALFDLDTLFGESLEKKIVKWTEDHVNIADLRKLNLSDPEASLLAFRLENASVNIPTMLGKWVGRRTYDLGILAADESFAVQWALTAFWSLTKYTYLDFEAMYLVDVIEDRQHK